MLLSFNKILSKSFLVKLMNSCIQLHISDTEMPSGILICNLLFKLLVKLAEVLTILHLTGYCITFEFSYFTNTSMSFSIPFSSCNSTPMEPFPCRRNSYVVQKSVLGCFIVHIYYLLSYANLQKSPRADGIQNVEGVNIYEEIVAYRNEEYNLQHDG